MEDTKALVQQMTLKEKCALMSGGGQFTSKAIPRLGIPAMYLSDGPNGVRKQAGSKDHLGLNPSLPATCFPTASAMANSWDLELGEQVGHCMGQEALCQRVNVLLGPGLNIKRSPLGGRSFEYFSEDPYLAGKMAAAYIRGIQSNGISACPKHFAANSQETLRMSSDSIVDERTLRELYLTGFEIAVKEGRPLTIMSSYNKLNGTYTNEDRKLLRDILVEQWGFRGMVVTDWGGSNDHVAGVRAGSHLEMPTPGKSGDQLLLEGIMQGQLTRVELEQRVEEFLNVLFQTVIPQDAPTEFDVESHHHMARRAAEGSIVLLKNENGLLPLKRGTRVAVIGDFARDPRYQGAGSSHINPTKLDIPLDCLKAAGLDVIGYAQGFDRNGAHSKPLRDEAVRLAQKADVVLLYLGLPEVYECEGMDRPHMKLPQNQNDTAEAVFRANDRVVVVLAGGAPVELPWAEQSKAIVHGYLSGQAGAGAMADVLTGTVNPSGKLSESWPLRYEDTPAFHHFPGKERTAEYREGLFVGYRYYQTAHVPVQYPFGYGLSYTTFAYGDLKATAEEVSFLLTNTGAVAGAEVAQVYVGKKDSCLYRPALELKGFTKVLLQPGESCRVTIALDDKAFRHFDAASDSFAVEGGVYQIWVGGCSNDLPLMAEVSVTGMGAAVQERSALLPSYYSGKVQQVSDKEFETLLGRPVPSTKWDRTKPLERNDTIAQLVYAKSGVARLVYLIIHSKRERSQAKGVPDLNIQSIYNMPFRGMAKLMGQSVDLDMVDSMLEMVNGRFFRGAGHLWTTWRAHVRREKAED